MLEVCRRYLPAYQPGDWYLPSSSSLAAAAAAPPASTTYRINICTPYLGSDAAYHACRSGPLWGNDDPLPVQRVLHP